jgi:putative ABC transport system substrate-binding protein
VKLLFQPLTWPLAVRAQQGALPVVGMLGATGEFQRSPIPAFSKSLEEAGFVEGRNLIIEYRGAEGHDDRLPALAGDLVRSRVNVIVALSGAAALSAKAATSTIPIVFVVGGDPVKLGLVATLNRPGGTVTGVTLLNLELLPKRLEVLHELLPSARSIAVLLNPSVEAQSREVQAAARCGAKCVAWPSARSSSRFCRSICFSAGARRPSAAYAISCKRPRPAISW